MTEPQNQQSAANSPAAGVAESIGVRNLKIIIVAMPFVFIAGVAAVIAIFGPPGGKGAADESPAASVSDIAQTTSASSEALDSISGSIQIPTGAAPGAMSLDGDRLAVRFDGADGTTVVIYDLKEKRVVDQIAFEND